MKARVSSDGHLASSSKGEVNIWLTKVLMGEPNWLREQKSYEM